MLSNFNLFLMYVSNEPGTLLKYSEKVEIFFGFTSMKILLQS